MSFTDTLKRSLGFEETESKDKKDGEGFNINEFINSLLNPSEGGEQNQQNGSQSMPKEEPVQEPTFVYDAYDDYVITPEQPFYEIVLIRPKTLDDINYVVDQILEEKNPVILDLSFLEKESPANFKLAGDKIKQMRSRFDAQAVLLARNEDKHLIILSPKKVRLVKKK